MVSRNLADRSVILGVLLLAVAATVIWISSGYSMGTVRRMGPGYFPVMLGGILALFGITITVRGLFFERQPIEKFAASQAIFILGGAALFGILLRPAGLLIAIAAMVGVAGLASTRLTIVKTALLAACLAAGSALVFVVALGQPIPLGLGLGY